MIHQQHSPPPPHQCWSAAETKTGSLSGLQSNIERGGGGSEGLLLFGRCIPKVRLKYMSKIRNFLNEFCPRLYFKKFPFCGGSASFRNVSCVNLGTTHESGFLKPFQLMSIAAYKFSSGNR